MADIIPIKQHKQFERKTRMSAAIALSEAKAHKPREILVIGINAEGELWVNGSPPDAGNAFWLMEMAKRKLCASDGNG